MQLQGNWNYPTSIRFGAGRAVELPALCRELGMRRPLLVTDPGLARLPMLARLRSLLSDSGLETALFSDMRPNPVGRDVDAGVAAFRDGRHDGVVAVGGGSALDVGKAIALMSGQNARCGTSRTWATTGCASIPPASRPHWRCPPPPAPAPRWDERP